MKNNISLYKNDQIPLVSVIVPTFNRKELLKETVESILSQSFANFELIIIDNMSEDGTKQYVENILDKRVKYLRNANGGIIAINRNLGIKNALGKYIAFCDDDDLWLPEKLSEQINVMESDADAALCYTNAQSFKDVNIIIENKVFKKEYFTSHYRKLLRGNVIPTSSVLLRREVTEIVGKFNENIRLMTVEDYDFWLRIAHQYKLIYINLPLIKYRINNNGNLGVKSKNALRNALVLKGIMKEHKLSAREKYKYIFIQYVRYLFFLYEELKHGRS